MTAPLIAAHHVSRRYRRGPEVVHALEGVTVALEVGELVALVGPSGSGKTTLLNLLAGWELPDEGQVLWEGRADTRLDRLGWDQIAIVPQALGVMDELSIRENVELPARIGASVGGLEAAAVLDRLGLHDVADRSPTEVSLGERQRAAIGRALRRRPRLLLADEPTGHQDATWASGVVAVLASACREEGTTAFVATHDEELLALVDRVVELRDGRLA